MTDDVAKGRVLQVPVSQATYDRLVAEQSSGPYPVPMASVLRSLIEEGLQRRKAKAKR